jgi:predicted membrane-bound spermidine synthase
VPRLTRAVLLAVFFATGFSALMLQTVWQRLIAVHNGVDLVSFTTVVAAFLAGLGVGGLLGGALADRLGPRRSVAAFAVSNLVIGVYAWFSTALFYDLYRDMRPNLGGTGAAFAFNVALLLVPTVLMGLSLPLLARGVVERVRDAGALVGRLYAINTLGAALGAAVAGWFVLGTFGFATAARIAGSLNLLAAVALLLLLRSVSSETAPASSATDRVYAPVGDAHVWQWFVVYGVTGAVALGYETVFFRVIDALMRSNSYSFPHLLSLYLVLFGVGTAIGSRIVTRVGRPDRWFLWIQVGVGATAALGLVVLTRLAPSFGGRGALRGYFGSDNFNIGFDGVDTAVEWAKLFFAYVAGPLVILGLPVLLMGAAYPFVQALVSQRMESLGRRTGTLFAANIAGNVVGTLLVGFVVLDRLGTIGTVRLLGVVLVVLGIVGVLRQSAPRHRVPALGMLAVPVVLLAALPSNQSFWAFLHGASDSEIKLDEERSCVNTTRSGGGSEMLFINASSQNAYPYDDFHLLIGLTPTLLHPNAKRVLTIGLGIGSTPYAVSRSEQIASVETVEICGGQQELLGKMAAEGKRELETLLRDPRVHIHEGDGRDWMLGTDDRYDVIVVDVLRPQSAYSGNLYSREFYQLASDRLAPGGLFAQWIPSGRTFNSATEVFSYVRVYTVASYNSQFMVASNDPLPDDAVLLRNLQERVPPTSFSSDQWSRIEAYYADPPTQCGRDGGALVPVPDDAINTDLQPRDEYFLNNSADVARRPMCAAP